MSKEDLNRDEEDIREESKPDDGGKSKDESEESSDESQGSEEDRDAKIERLEKTVADLKKGVDKAFSDKGRQEKDKPEEDDKSSEKKETPKYDDEVVEELLITKHPEAEHVLDELKEVAEQKGESILKVYRKSKYFQGEAKAIADSKKSEDESKAKISNPTSVVGKGGNIRYENIDLDKPEHVKWLKAKPERKKGYDEWLLKRK